MAVCGVSLYPVPGPGCCTSSGAVNTPHLTQPFLVCYLSGALCPSNLHSTANTKAIIQQLTF